MMCVPLSLRSRYPLIPTDDELTVPAQKVVEVQPTSPQARGFDAKTSREMPLSRGRFTNVFSNSDTSQTTVFSLGPVNYQKADGSWAPIDTTLIKDRLTGGWQVTANQTRSAIAPTADAHQLGLIELDDEHIVGWSVAGAKKVSGQASGSKVLFPDFVPGADLELVVQPGGIKETIILQSKDAARSYSFPLPEPVNLSETCS